MEYVYDGTLDGLLCCIFRAFERRETPEEVHPRMPSQLSLLGAPVCVETEEARARRVEAGIARTGGMQALSAVRDAVYSANPHAGRDAVRYARLVFRYGPAVHDLLTDDTLLCVRDTSQKLWREVGQLREFLRFRELENGVYIAEMTPENDVTELLMPHFADRFGDMSFILHDRGRKKAGVFDTRGWVIASSEQMRLPEISAREARYQSMWKLFYETIAIKARENPRQRRQFMPKKYWRDLPEMQGPAVFR
ncbi:TIGR03915 family putative DNA repair protein [Beduinella massiliensis]|uniref:TIGR03915 family putative DNA repair protein n=1 Tax=Beduinella massiliensis TaxID=1852363 RepID=UPI0031F7EF8A